MHKPRKQLTLTGDSTQIFADLAADAMKQFDTPLDKPITEAERDMIAQVNDQVIFARLYEIFAGAGLRSETVINQKLLAAKDQGITNISDFLKGFTGDIETRKKFAELIEGEEPNFAKFYALIENYSRLMGDKSLDSLATFFDPHFTNIFNRQARHSPSEVILHFYRDPANPAIWHSYVYMFSSEKIKDMFYMLKFKVRVPDIADKHVHNTNSPKYTRLLNAIVNKAKMELTFLPEETLKKTGEFELGFMSCMIPSPKVYSGVAHNPAWPSTIQLHREAFDRRLAISMKSAENPLFAF